MSVPLSRGVNAIIGDNSIGKSLLLHKLTKYYRLNIEPTLSPLTKTIVNAYEDYLDERHAGREDKVNIPLYVGIIGVIASLVITYGFIVK